MLTGSRGTRQREVAASSLKAASGNQSSLVADMPLRRALRNVAASGDADEAAATLTLGPGSGRAER